MKKIYKHIIGLVLLSIPMILNAQTTTENHVVSKVYRKATQTPVVTNHKDSVAMSIQYVDGLGRPKQSVAVQAGGNLTHRNSLLYDWTLGNSGSTPFYNQQGTDLENNIISGTTPFGDTDLLWECKDDNNGGGSGWITDNITVDPTKAYRYTTWVKINDKDDGRVYHGPWGVNNLDGTANSNPYFYADDLPASDTWYLLVGIVHPHNHTGGDTGVSGVYDHQGNKVIDATEFKWDANSTTARFRNYVFLMNNANTRLHFWSPLVQQINGSEFPLSEVVTTTSVVIDEIVASDIVIPIDYDQYGRQMKEYLPYASVHSDGRINTNAIAKNQQYYLENHAGDFPGITDPTLVNAYSEKVLESSPLGRIYEQTAPGNDWKKTTSLVTGKGYSDGHTIKFEYLANAANEVRKYGVTTSFANNTYTPSLTGGTTDYPVGELTKTITKDENWVASDVLNKTTEEFKNKNGQVILKRTYNGGQAHDTYYVYDDYGNLTYVLPPKAEGDTTVPTSTVLSELCYQYKYDSRNRLVAKKIPGKGWESIIYDKLDRPVMTQDAIQATNNEWLVTKYDQLGRVAYTGIYDHGSSSTRIAMQSSFDTQNDLSSELYEQKVNNSTGKDGSYYTDNHFPSGVNLEVLTANYYDDYNFNLAGGSAPTSVYTVTPTTNVKGLATGSRVRILGTTNWTTTVTYYDERARPIYIYSKNDYLGTTDIVESKLDDFTGRLIETRTTHQKTGQDDVVTIDNFEYDHRDRLIAQTQKINNQLPERLVKNHYDELGQLESKLVGNGTQKGYTDVTSDISIINDQISRTTGSGWDVGLVTISSFAADGYLEYEIPSTSGHIKVGLTEVNTDAGFTIPYAIYHAHNSLVIYADGQNEGIFGTFVAGDIFRIERIKDQLFFKKNGIVLYSTLGVTGTFMGDLSIHSTAKSIKDFRIVDNSKGLQKVDYAYNVRGWLKNINQDSDNDNDLFNFSLRYNNPTSGTALYNGNISQTSWNTLSADASTKTYTYSYDALNRIISGIDNTGNYNLTSVSYDKNGNILNLERQGHTNFQATSFGVMDDLTYTYDAGNKLTKVDDAGHWRYGFKDNTAYTGPVDYTYDANGNMLTDLNKNIASTIQYNHLNLPTNVSIDGWPISYVYDATGVKLRKVVNDHGAITTTDYAGNFIYEDNKLQFFNHAEGYVKHDGTNGYEYVYQYKDHLGNVRLSYTDADNDGSISSGVVSTYYEEDFDNTSSVSPWGGSYGEETLSIENNTLKCTIEKNYRGAFRNMNLEAGKTYRISYTVDLNNTNLEFQTKVYGVGGIGVLYDSGLFTTSGTYTFDISVTQTHHEYKLRFYGLDPSISDSTTPFVSPVSFYIDNVSVYEIDANTSEIIEESNYYPFGLKHKGYNNVVSSNGNSVAQKFKYNGMELENALGIDWYEMDMRQYDPAIARWTAIDPVTHHSMSTYTAFDNNPIFWADPSGADSITIQDFDGNDWTVDSETGGNEKRVDPKEGDTRESKKVVGYGAGAVAIPTTQYYHAGNWGEAGWYSGKEYLKILESLAVSVARFYGGWNQTWDGKVTALENSDIYYLFMKDREVADGFTAFLLNYAETLKNRHNIKLRASASGRVNAMGFSSPFFMGAGLLKNLASASITSSDGFLFGGLSIKAPFNIPVQRFGQMSISRPDFWGLRIGSNKFVNRFFAAIKPEWNSLTQYTTGIIPRGTRIRVGFIGPQGLKYPGGSIQFINNSSSVINQSSKIIK
ncbi:MAG: hypothetical protein JXQ93_03340 [Flavobacteriaceae bacterium]